MKKLFFIIAIMSLFGFYTGNSYAQMLTADQVKVIEAQIDKELLSSKLDSKKKLIANLLAGREFYQYRFYDKSKKYYEAAKKIETKENKSEAYINLIAIGLMSKDKKEMQNAFDEATKYFKKNTPYNTTDIQYYMNSMKNYLSGKHSGELKGFYGHFVREGNLIDLVKKKNYQEALSKLNPAGMEEAGTNLEVIIYDALNVALHKKSVKKLYCLNEYKKYPNAYTYSSLICGLLNDYIEKSEFNSERMKRAQKYFTEEDNEKIYLLDVVKEIK